MNFYNLSVNMIYIYIFTIQLIHVTEKYLVSSHVQPMRFWYSRTFVKPPLSKSPKNGFQDEYLLMQVKSIAECSKEIILQYFRPSLSYQLSLTPLFCLFLSDCFTQVLLYLSKVPLLASIYTRDDQKVCRKVLLNCIAFIDCNENS